MSRLRVRKIARAEIVAAFEWYLHRFPAAAQQFLHAVEEAMRMIEESPERYPVIRGHLRRLLLQRFPYAIYYKVFPMTISVVGVIHGHRHQDSWLQRVEP
ncbi:MAG: type II toxin-antitoxin system RelE/ParE family toxin [Nitrospirales bacterium]|nr:type II toxin-antitoxin system RelE/ParE family toxin [Nitrospirales bacterium]